MCARDVLLIDEMSLITPNMLADIDRALKKATRCEHDFGNWLVILSGDEAEIEAGSDEDVPGGSDPIVRALGRARGGGDGDEAEIEAGSDEDVPGGADPIVRALGRARGGGNGNPKWSACARRCRCTGLPIVRRCTMGGGLRIERM